MICQNFSEIRPTQIEASAKIAEWQDDPERRVSCHGGVDASIHAVECDDGGWVLRNVEAARHNRFWTLEYRGVGASTMHQPGDPFFDGHATNTKQFVCVWLKRSRICQHSASKYHSGMIVSDVTSRLIVWRSFRKNILDLARLMA